ncbi:MAG: DUF2254 domain-containing protein [Enhydrobacter sp.]|nr:DUF2254 domain-containing protein [Enhydrobacter sp.]
MPRLLSFLSPGRLLATWDRLRESFWFLPTLMAAGAIGLSFGLTSLDAAVEDETYRRLDWLYLFGAEGARAILSAIASSMITVAGLTFSITMLTLQLASSQFGPRLLRNFLRDRGNQVVLGTFIATFLYCLLVLRTVKGVEGSSFVPHISVAVGILMSIASLAVLIYFIHHTAHSIRVETILASLADETGAAIERLFPERLGQEPSDVPEPERSIGPAAAATARLIRPERSGYVQMIDGDALMNRAVERDIVVHLAVGPGAFVTPDDVLLTAAPGARIDAAAAHALRTALVIGAERTPTQDLSFSIRRIVEIAQRALSPSVNDPTTAIYCIDRLGEALARLAGRKMPTSHRLDPEGHLRVVAQPVSFGPLAQEAFAAVARYGMADVDVVRALLHTLDRLTDRIPPSERGTLAGLAETIRREAAPHPL